MHAIREPPESPGGSKQSSHGPSYGVASTGAQWVQSEQRPPLHEASAMHQSSQARARARPRRPPAQLYAWL